MYRDDSGIWTGERLGHPIDRGADREHQADQLERFFELSGLYDTFSSDKTQQERFDSFFSIDNEGLSGYLNRVNGVLRNLPATARGFADEFQYIGGDPATSTKLDFIPTFYEDKETILNELFDKARTAKSPQEAATLLGFGLNIVHPFSDGNGRVSRLVYTSILHGFNRIDDKLKLLAGNTGDKLLDINGCYYTEPVFKLLKMDSPSFVTTVVNGVHDAQPIVLPAVHDGSVPIFHERDADNPEIMKRMLLFSFLLEKNMSEFIAAGVKRDAGNNQLDVKTSRIIRNFQGKDHFLLDRFLTEGSTADIDRAVNLARRMARVFTKRFFREFTAPYNQQMTIGLYTKEFGMLPLRFAEFGSHIAEKVVTPADLPEHYK